MGFFLCLRSTSNAESGGDKTDWESQYWYRSLPRVTVLVVRPEDYINGRDVSTGGSRSLSSAFPSQLWPSGKTDGDIMCHGWPL
mmetsp:Transcript_52801/g.107735  ORF Transcript_52801/g.107735 Transcript_52801/m.107735 type:complete len:84 (+) Transcript_52801:1109-1360(+)